MSGAKVDVRVVLLLAATRIRNTDVLVCSRQQEELCHQIADQVIKARAAIAELIDAAKNYYTGYCQDEADEDDDDMRFCSREQHEAAARLRTALAAIGSEK